MSKEKKPFQVLAALRELQFSLQEQIEELDAELQGSASDATKSHPRQPIVWVDDIIRFKENPIVRYLLDSHPTVDLNDIARLPNITTDDRSQFNQLIGYSVSAYSGLSCANEQHVGEANDITDAMVKERLESRPK